MNKWLTVAPLAVALMWGPGCTSQDRPVSTPTTLPTSVPAAGTPAPGQSGHLAGMSPTIHTLSGLTFLLPDDWTRSSQDPGLLTVTRPDDELQILISAQPARRTGEFFDNLEKELADRVAEPRIDRGSVSSAPVNGLPVKRAAGECKLKDRPARWELRVVEGTAENALVVLAVGDVEANRSTLSAIFESIRPSETDELRGK